MEDRPTAQMEGIDPAVVRDIPTLCEIAARLVKPVLLDIAARLIQCLSNKPIVEVPRHTPG